jgi:hypothetical protein
MVISYFSILAAVDGVFSVPRGDAITLTIAGVVVTIFLALGLPAIPALIREIKFYQSCGWDFRRDSGVFIYKQKEFASRFWFLPVGLIKLLYQTNRILIMLIVVIPLGVGAIRSFS